MRPWEYATRNLSDDLFNGGLDKLRMFLSKLKPLVLIADWRTISDIKSKDFLMLMEWSLTMNALFIMLYNIKIQGITGKCRIKWKGTWNFEIADDEGTRRYIKLPHMLYCKHVPYFLLSPQLWSQHNANPSREHCKVGHEYMELVWDSSRMQQRVKLNPSNNCGIIWSAPV